MDFTDYNTIQTPTEGDDIQVSPGAPSRCIKQFKLLTRLEALTLDPTSQLGSPHHFLPSWLFCASDEDSWSRIASLDALNIYDVPGDDVFPSSCGPAENELHPSFPVIRTTAACSLSPSTSSAIPISSSHDSSGDSIRGTGRAYRKGQRGGSALERPHPSSRGGQTLFPRHETGKRMKRQVGEGQDDHATTGGITNDGECPKDRSTPRETSRTMNKPRLSHNEIEKRYRTRLNAEFDRLLASLPNTMTMGGGNTQDKHRSVGKAKVLCLARERIDALELQNESLRHDVEQLRKHMELSICRGSD